MAQQGPDYKVLECIDRGMGSLGESSRAAIYWHFEHAHGLRREDIPRNPQAFRMAMQSMFGLGAVVLERLIVMEIRSAFKIPDKVESLEQAVKEALGKNK